MAESENLTLISKEGEQFRVPPDFAEMCILVQNMLEGNGNDFSEEVPLPTVSSEQLRKIIEYCQLHNYQKAQTDLVFPLPSKVPSEFISDARELAFIEQFNEEQLIDMIAATNFMHIPALFELCCAMIAASLKGKDFN